MKTTYLILKVVEDLPSSPLGNHQLFETSCKLVPHPVKRGTTVNLSRNLGGNETRTQSQIKVLDEEQKIRGKLDPLSDPFH